MSITPEQLDALLTRASNDVLHLSQEPEATVDIYLEALARRINQFFKDKKQTDYSASAGVHIAWDDPRVDPRPRIAPDSDPIQALSDSHRTLSLLMSKYEARIAEFETHLLNLEKLVKCPNMKTTVRIIDLERRLAALELRGCCTGTAEDKK